MLDLLDREDLYEYLIANWDFVSAALVKRSISNGVLEKIGSDRSCEYESEQCFLKALDVDPDNYNAYYVFWYYLYLIWEYDKSLQCFLNGLDVLMNAWWDVKEDITDFNKTIWDIYRTKNDYIKALDYYYKANTNQDAIYRIAELNYNLSNYKKSFKYGVKSKQFIDDRLLDISPNEDHTLKELLDEKYNIIISFFSCHEMIWYNRDIAEIYIKRWDILLGYNQVENALESYCVAIKFSDAESRDLQLKVAECYYMLWYYNYSSRIYSKYKDYLDYDEWSKRWNCLEKQLLYDEALDVYFKILDDISEFYQQEYQDILLHIAECYLNKEEYIKSIEICDKIIKIDKNNYSALDKKKQCLCALDQRIIKKKELNNVWGKFFLVLDTETTWFINNSSSFNDRPYIVQFACVMLEKNADFLEEVDRLNLYIKPPVHIPYAVSNIHWIYDKDVINNWDFKAYSNKIIDMIGKADVLVWHNIKYDLDIVLWELTRIKMENVLNGKISFCTMRDERIIKYCQLRKKDWSFKWPKLQELYFVLFKKYFMWAHNAMDDVKATVECLQMLIQKGVIDI